MLKPICVPCQRFFRMQKTGLHFTEGMPAGHRVPPGNSEPDNWRPYKIWSGDVWLCKGCGATIIAGTGREPIAVQHEVTFQETARQLNAAQFQVNDC